MHHDASLARLAASATLHCLTGCAIGEILGMLIGTALGLPGLATVAISIALAFAFGYGLSTLPLLRSGMAVGAALSLVLAADTLSIATMEVVDNLVMLVIPGAMDAGLVNPLFWVSMAIALAVAFAAAFPVNRWLIARGKGHALVHEHHGGHGGTGAQHDPAGAAHDHAAHDHAGHAASHGDGEHHSPAAGRPWIPDLSTSALVAAIAAFLAGGLVVSIADQLTAAVH